jgi:hypothetical protein
MHRLFQLLSIFILFQANTLSYAQIATPVREGKPWAYWWWMGSAVTKEGIRQNLEAYAKAGIGGLHNIPIYGAKGYESQYVSCLSPQWMDIVQYTVQEAGRLNMGIDMSMGTGWPFGGAMVDKTATAKKFVVKEFALPAGKAFNSFLKPDSTNKDASLQTLSLYDAGGKFTHDLTRDLDVEEIFS